MTSYPRFRYRTLHTQELTAYGRGAGFHYARRRSDDGVERHADGLPCKCPNAAAYAPVTPASAIWLWAVGFLAFDRVYPPDIGGVIDPRTPAEVMLAGLITPQDFLRYLQPWPAT